MTRDRITGAAEFLLAQRAPGAVLTSALPDALKPRDAAEARAMQLALLDEIGPVGGWKVGISPTGEIVASPLPVSGVKPAPAEFR